MCTHFQELLMIFKIDTWNVEINILVYENEIFSLPGEFHFKMVLIQNAWFPSLK